MSANLNLILRGVRSEKVKVFTSATKPLLLPFYYRNKGDDTDQPNTFTMMFKTGDDMRQDQLVLQLFSIMDRVLKDVNLDCKFTIYDLIAFTTDDGLLPFVPDSDTITAILKEHKTIGAYLKSHAKDDDDYERILDNYIVSCAGYCTATYLLGIGDRHLENLMITKDGMFFHIDFGFIFGKEPGSKGRLASKFRISKDMVTPMGGVGSANYAKFSQKFVETFLILRNKISYILNLMHLMIHSGI